jgi:hypothetical protein
VLPWELHDSSSPESSDSRRSNRRSNRKRFLLTFPPYLSKDDAAILQAIALDPEATPEALAELIGVEMHDLCLRMAFFELAGLIEDCSGPLRLTWSGSMLAFDPDTRRNP